MEIGRNVNLTTPIQWRDLECIRCLRMRTFFFRARKPRPDGGKSKEGHFRPWSQLYSNENVIIKFQYSVNHNETCKHKSSSDFQYSHVAGLKNGWVSVDVLFLWTFWPYLKENATRLEDGCLLGCCTLCSLLETYWRSRGACSLHHHCRRKRLWNDGELLVDYQGVESQKTSSRLHSCRENRNLTYLHYNDHFVNVALGNNSCLF